MRTRVGSVKPLATQSATKKLEWFIDALKRIAQDANR